MTDHTPMTTNIDRAAEVMREAHDKPHWSPMHRCDNMAQALADAGLLRSDLPMAEEVEYRIVDPDTNGGKYEMRRWVREVTEWRLDNE